MVIEYMDYTSTPFFITKHPLISQHMDCLLLCLDGSLDFSLPVVFVQVLKENLH